MKTVQQLISGQRIFGVTFRVVFHAGVYTCRALDQKTGKLVAEQSGAALDATLTHLMQTVETAIIKKEGDVPFL